MTTGREIGRYGRGSEKWIAAGRKSSVASYFDLLAYACRYDVLLREQDTLRVARLGSLY
jgi:hypothetical protein